MTAQNPPVSRRRIIGFTVFCAVCIAGALLYFVYSRAKSGNPAAPPGNSLPTSNYQIMPAHPGADPASAETKRGLPQALPALSAPAKPSVSDKAAATSQDALSAKQIPQPKLPLLFRITALSESYGQVGEINLLDPNAPIAVSSLRCERLHFAAGAGVCLNAERHMLVTYSGVVFNRDFQPRHQLRLSGLPSRVRVAPNGRTAAFTVFVSGHSYAAANFSTLTTFVDLDKGETLVDDMEKFMVTRDGERVQGADFNFWGVTFKRDSNGFYATLATGGHTFLVEGDFAARQAKLLRPGIECPALSPDNSRVAFKKRTGGAMSPVSWRLSVLDLRTMQERQLAETRSVDDQVEWLDNNSLLYSLPAAASGTAATNTWTVPADGSGTPRLLVPNAYSPVVLRE